MEADRAGRHRDHRLYRSRPGDRRAEPRNAEPGDEGRLEQPAAHTGDFDALSQALAAIDAAHPEITQIRCYEYTVDDEYPREAAALVKTSGKWAPHG
jgi:hypothetical protein